MPDQPVGLPRIQARVNPGGVVLHVYATPGDRLLDTVLGDTIAMASFAAGGRFDMHQQQLSPHDGLMLVCYSGDTGQRLADDGQPVPRYGLPLVARAPVDLGDDPDGDIEGYDGR